MELMINRVPIWIAETKRDGSEQAPSLFFIHGAGGDASMWHGQTEYLRGQYDTYCMELPAHGRSGRAEVASILEYAQWVRLAVENYSHSGCQVLVGHSLGGAIVLEIATNPPEGIKGIVLLGTGAKLGVMPAIFEMLEHNPDDFFQTMGKAAFAASTPRAVRDRVLNVMRKSPPSIIAKDFRACDQFDIRDRLQEISLPALILCGEEDRLTPAKYSQYLHEKIASSRLVIIPRAGHMVMAEQPESVNRALVEFIIAFHG